MRTRDQLAALAITIFLVVAVCWILGGIAKRCTDHGAQPSPVLVACSAP